MEDAHIYTKGEWIVHSQYGIGQIKGIDEKEISGEKSRYFRVKTTDSTFWVPVDKIDSEAIRPLSTAEEIQQAIDALQKPPEAMSSNFKVRQKRIRQAQIRNTPRAIARLLRDLRARRRQKGILNSSERSAFRSLRQQLVEEWALVKGIKTETAASKIDILLDPDRAATEDGPGTAVMAAKETVPESAPPSPPKQKKWWVWSKSQMENR